MKSNYLTSTLTMFYLKITFFYFKALKENSLFCGTTSKITEWPSAFFCDLSFEKKVSSFHLPLSHLVMADRRSQLPVQLILWTTCCEPTKTDFQFCLDSVIRELFLKGWLILCSCWSELFNVVVMFCLCSIKPIWNHIVLTGFQWDLPKTLFRLKDISANFARPNYRLMKKQKSIATLCNI